MHHETHYVHRTGWLRAAVLGANDGLVSISSLIMGVVASDASKQGILLAGIAGLVAGAMSMAAGEYVSVSTQADTEKADLEKEKRELKRKPEYELNELKENFMERGLTEETAMEVAEQLTAHDALSAHAREELGITDFSAAQPMQAALTSAITFTIGASLPLICAILSPKDIVGYAVIICTLLSLAFLGAISAKAGGARKRRAMLRTTFWGAGAMAFTALVGYIFGVSVS